LNNAGVLDDCIKSVLNQSHNSIEHILIDGGSKDDTIKILKKYQNHLTKFISEPDQGIYHAMNKGINLADGDVIGFLNSDDFYAHNKVLSKVCEMLDSNPELDACYSDLIYVDKLTASKTIRYFKSSQFIPGSFSRGWCPPHPTFFVRSTLFKKYGNFDINFNIASDVDLMMRFLEVYNIKSVYVPETWVKMRMGGTTNKNLANIILQNREILVSLKKNGLPDNKVNFFINKIISRSKQFFKLNK
tara:strand:- start:605 stop:1339 length:735 start_codon:yes stop_codon:yes gene_type:complete